MTHDIYKFVTETHSRQSEGGLVPIGGASDRVVSEVLMWCRSTFDMELPAIYVEICKLEDQLACDGATMHGMGTYYDKNSEYPAYEGLMEVQERNIIDLGPQELIEFGNQYGTDPWGYNLRLKKFVRSDTNRRDAMTVFDSFEDMFRALFGLGDQE